MKSTYRQEEYSQATCKTGPQMHVQYPCPDARLNLHYSTTVETHLLIRLLRRTELQTVTRGRLKKRKRVRVKNPYSEACVMPVACGNQLRTVFTRLRSLQSRAHRTAAILNFGGRQVYTVVHGYCKCGYIFSHPIPFPSPSLASWQYYCFLTII